MDTLTQTDVDHGDESADEDDARRVDGDSVEIDGVLLALVDFAVANESNDHDSRGDLVSAALEGFLGPAVAGDHRELERQVSTDRQFTIETDLVLGYLLKVAIQDDDQFESPSEFAKHAVVEALDIELDSVSVDVPDYDRYEFVVEQLVASDDCPHETPGDIVHAALEHHLEVPTS